MTHRAPLIVASYQNDWPNKFASERLALEAIFPEHRFQIEHVGSTAVAGLSAKPIIDIMIGASSLSEIDERIDSMTALGYEYMPHHEQAIPLRRFLAKPRIRPRAFHVHAVTVNGSFWNDHLTFRDALRSDLRLANDYAALKSQLAQQFGEDREAYTDAKGSFIRAAIAAARISNTRAWFGYPIPGLVVLIAKRSNIGSKGPR